jgi:restriction system protein
MAVPDFQSWFLPLLKRLADGKDHGMSELYQVLADDMGLSGDDRAQLLKSGAQLVFENRIGWARTYLKKAGLIEAPSRGVVRITERGKSILAKPPEKLNVKFLRQFPEFVEFHTYKPDASSPNTLPVEVAQESPLDTLERVHGELEQQLAEDILERVKKAPPAFFERLVVDLLLAMGYGGSREDAGKTIGKSGDGGIDGVINEDRLGLDVLYIQAKRWEQAVGRPVVQAFAGSLEGVRARKGVLITTSSFTSDANQYVRQIEKKIVLIDGTTLATLMIQHNVGVGIEAAYQVKKLDSDYFPE